MGQLRWPFFAAEGCSRIPPGVPLGHPGCATLLASVFIIIKFSSIYS